MSLPTISEMLKMAEKKKKDEWEFVDKLRIKNVINRTAKQYASEWIKYDQSSDEQEKEKIIYGIGLMENVFNEYLRHCMDVFDDDKNFKGKSMNEIIEWYKG